MRFLTKRDGGLSAHFDVIDGSEDGIINSSLEQKLFNNRTEVNRGVKRRHLPLKDIFAFLKYLKKKTKGLDFELEI